MTKKTERTLEEARPAGTELVTVPVNGLSRNDLDTSGSGRGNNGDEPSRAAPGVISLYLHAFRRHWPLAITLGLVCGAAAMAPAWFLATERYTAVALLKVSSNGQQLVFHTADRASESSFEVYKGTQQQMLTSDVVLIAALRKPAAASLAVVQKEDDPVRWLARNLRVDFPGNAEIMRISLTDDHPDEAATLVGAVVDAYMNEVVDAEGNRQRDRMKDLDRLFTEKETEMRSRRTELKQLAEAVGTGDTGALLLKQQIALQSYAEARNELVRIRSELRRAQDDLKLKQAWLKALQSTPEAADPEPVIAADEFVARLSGQIEELDDRVAKIRETTKEPLRSKLAAEYAETKKKLVEKAENRRKEIREKLQKMNKGGKTGLDPQIVELKFHIDILAEQVKEASKETDDQQKKAERFGNWSIDVEMMRNDIQYLDRVLVPIADERERLKVELRSTQRITRFQEAAAPHSPDGKPRIQTAAMSGCGGFFGVVFLVLWWDVRKQRINSLADLSRGLGLTVIGTVPLLPQKVLRAGLTVRTGKRHRQWQNSLNHAVDSIAARLFLRKEAEGVRVVMVSSAIQGEGKTTLAIQLATRLARLGERTLLVDYDLRKPSIHRIFSLPRGPGVSECLQKELELDQVARATETENLFVVTAGESLLNSLGPLANGATTSFFEKARAGFTFVVVDGSPILPVIDGLLVSQHADTVVLSVRRDTSQAPQVLRTCEKLVAFGSRKYVVVLNGSHEEACGDYQEHIISARVETAAADKTPQDEIHSVPTA
jgi:capsular exopolysaccharide synthesis family protein